MKTISNTDTYQRITDYVIDQLEKGQVIWQKQWNSLGLPKNIISGHRYQGWNVFFLNFITTCHQYKTPYFITYKQALDAGGIVGRGQKGYPVVWWATVEGKIQTKKIDEENEPRIFRIPKIHTVFNIDQTHGIDFPKIENLFRSHSEKLEACEQVVQNMQEAPIIRHQGDKAYYNPLSDQVIMPDCKLFHTCEGYYKTLFHELAHSTGHEKRLNRKELRQYDGFSGENYSKEELTAELTAAFISAICGIEQQILPNSAAYIQGWLKVLKNDKRLILKSASQAQSAANYILQMEDDKAGSYGSLQRLTIYPA